MKRRALAQVFSGKLSCRRRLSALALGAAIAIGACVAPRTASAQLPPPKRSLGWETTSNVAMAVGLGSQLLMPRLFWSDTEVTIGWKTRWHASIFAPTMFVLSTALFSELVIKPEITSYRPGCGPSNAGVAGCTTFGMPSSQTFVAFSALGNGAGIFVVDMLKWNDGKIHGGSLVGHLGVPLLAAGLTFAGRIVGTPSQEHGDQAVVGGALGLAFGVVTGGLYAYFQRPECPYGAGVICW